MQEKLDPPVPVSAGHFEYRRNRPEGEYQVFRTQIALLAGEVAVERVLLHVRAEVVVVLVSGQRAKMNIAVELVVSNCRILWTLVAQRNHLKGQKIG